MIISNYTSTTFKYKDYEITYSLKNDNILFKNSKQAYICSSSELITGRFHLIDWVKNSDAELYKNICKLSVKSSVPVTLDHSASDIFLYNHLKGSLKDERIVGECPLKVLDYTHIVNIDLIKEDIYTCEINLANIPIKYWRPPSIKHLHYYNNSFDK